MNSKINCVVKILLYQYACTRYVMKWQHIVTVCKWALLKSIGYSLDNDNTFLSVTSVYGVY